MGDEWGTDSAVLGLGKPNSLNCGGLCKSGKEDLARGGRSRRVASRMNLGRNQSQRRRQKRTAASDIDPERALNPHAATDRFSATADIEHIRKRLFGDDRFDRRLEACQISTIGGLVLGIRPWRSGALRDRVKQTLELALLNFQFPKPSGFRNGSVAKFEIPPRLGILPENTQTAKRR